jgi:hypothetical protein
MNKYLLWLLVIVIAYLAIFHLKYSRFPRWSDFGATFGNPNAEKDKNNWKLF